MAKVHVPLSILLWSHFLTGTNSLCRGQWRTWSAMTMAARASTSSRVDGRCSTLKTSRVCRSRFSTCRSQAFETPSISSRKNNLNDWKVVQTSTSPQHSLAVDLNGCAMRLVPSPPDPPLPRREHAFTRVTDTFSSGVVRAIAVSASGTSGTCSPQSSSPPSWATEKSPAAHLSTSGRRAVPWLTGAGCTGLQENGRSLVMGVPGSFGAVSDSDRVSCKWSDRVKETPELIELGRFRSCKCTPAVFGGVTLWALAPEENGNSLVVGW